MSTNIHCAWLVPTQDLTELTKLGNELEKLWLESYIDEAAKDIANWPWTKNTATTLSAIDEGFQHTRRLTRKVLDPLISMYQKYPTWIMDDAQREMRDHLIRTYMTDEDKALFNAEALELLRLHERNRHGPRRLQ